MRANSDRPVFREYAEFRAIREHMPGSGRHMGFLSQFQKLGETVNRLLARSVEMEVCIQTVRRDRPHSWFALSACDRHV